MTTKTNVYKLVKPIPLWIDVNGDGPVKNRKKHARIPFKNACKRMLPYFKQKP